MGVKSVHHRVPTKAVAVRGLVRRLRMRAVRKETLRAPSTALLLRKHLEGARLEQRLCALLERISVTKQLLRLGGPVCGTIQLGSTRRIIKWAGRQLHGINVVLLRMLRLRSLQVRHRVLRGPE